MAPILGNLDTCKDSATTPNAIRECLIQTITQYNRYYHDYALSRHRDKIEFYIFCGGFLIFVVVYFAVWSVLAHWLQNMINQLENWEHEQSEIGIEVLNVPTCVFVARFRERGST